MANSSDVIGNHIMKDEPRLEGDGSSTEDSENEMVFLYIKLIAP